MFIKCTKRALSIATFYPTGSRKAFYGEAWFFVNNLKTFHYFIKNFASIEDVGRYHRYA